MKRDLAFIILVAVLLGHSTTTARAETWPGWRGPRGDGTCIEQDVPTDWDPASALWKTELPGKGHASPIVWGGRVLTVTAISATKERMLLCLDRNTGSILWQRTVVQGPLEKINKENSHASGTPATDGERVYVAFRVGDDIVVAAHDFDNGKQLWLVRAGTHTGEWGFSNEPVLFKDKVIVDGDSKGDSFLIALGRKDGKTRWRINRTNKGISYSAPLIREMAGRTQLIQCGDRCVAGFDPETGEQLWKVDDPSQEFVATPVYSERAGLVFVSSSWPKRMLLAIRPDGRGDVTDTHITWSDTKGAPYVPSMIVAGDFLLSVNNSDFKKRCKRKLGRKPRYGAVGKHGSIAVIERFIRTFKDIYLRKITIPYASDHMRSEMTVFIQWYNAFRPHESLEGATPLELYENQSPASKMPRYEPRKRWPRKASCAHPVVSVKGECGSKLELIISFMDDHGKLPVIELREAA